MTTPVALTIGVERRLQARRESRADGASEVRGDVLDRRAGRHLPPQVIGLGAQRVDDGLPAVDGFELEERGRLAELFD